MAIAAAIVLVNLPLAVNAAPTYSHIVYVEYENKEYSQIIGSTSCPYITQLSQQGALFTNFYAQTHPSQPNYLYAFSGCNQGVTSDASAIDGGGSANGTRALHHAQPLCPVDQPGLHLRRLYETLPSVGYTGDGISLGERPVLHGEAQSVVNWQAVNNSQLGPNQIPSTLNMPYTSCPISSSGNSRHLQRLLVAAEFLLRDPQRTGRNAHRQHSGGRRRGCRTT